MATLEQVRCLVAVADHGSLSIAGEVIQESESSVLGHIRRLEGQVGSALVHRSGDSVILTDAALELLHDETLSRPVVSFGVCRAAHHLLVEKVLSEFRSSDREVSVRCFGLTSDEVARAVSEGRLDLGLVALPLHEDGIEVGAGPWRSEHVYVSADRRGRRRVLDDLAIAARDLILPDIRWGDVDQAVLQFSRRTPQAGIRTTVESHAAALALAARGAGDTIMALPLVDCLGYSAQLDWTSLDPPVVDSLALVVQKREDVSPAVERLMKRLAMQLEEDFAVSPAPSR